MTHLSVADASTILRRFTTAGLASCTRLGGLSSANFHLTADDRRQYVLKCAALSYVRDFDEILASYRAFAAHGVPAVAPLAGLDTRFLQVYRENTYVLFPYVAGKTFHQDTFTAAALKSAGEVLARIHGIEAGGWRNTASFLTHQQEMKQALMQLDLRSTHAGELIRDSLHIKAELQELLAPRLTHPVDHVLLHGDFHNGNLLFGSDDSVMGVIDLELTMVGDAGRDYLRFIDLACCNTACEDANIQMAEIFLRAYRAARRLDRSSFEASMIAYLHDSCQSTFFEAQVAFEGKRELTPFVERDIKKYRFYGAHLDEFMKAIWA